MNKTLKWILIGLAIALGVFIVALPVFYFARHAGNLVHGFAWRMPMRAPFVMHSRISMFGGVFRLFGGLFVLGLIALAVFGVVALARGNNRTPMTPPPAPPVAPVQTAQTASAVLPASDTRVCRNCGKTIPVVGEYCPFCGAKQ